MIDDINVLSLFKTKENYTKYKNHLNKKNLSIEGKELFNAIEQYYDKYPDTTSLDKDKFTTFFRHVYDISMKKEETDFYSKAISKLVTLEEDVVLLDKFNRSVLNEQIIDKVNNNIDPIELMQYIRQYNINTNISQVLVDSELKALLETHDRDNTGYLWRAQAMNEGYGRLAHGDFIVIAAYANVGKTTFVTSEASHWAKQLGPQDTILYFNTEGPAEYVQLNLYRSMLGCTYETLKSNTKAATETFLEHNGGAIKVIRAQRMHYTMVEKLILQYNPKIVIIDLLDHIQGFSARSSETSDMKFEKLYQWARDLAALYCPVVATSQLNGEASGELFPDITNMKGSQAAKQGAASGLIFLGKPDNTPDYNLRGLSIPKKKTGSDYYKAKVYIDTDTARVTSGDR